MAHNSRVRVAVISDVHANLYALEAVLGEIDREPPDAIWCLGDTVGYGPRPNECCAIVRERAAVTLIGNHDLVALGAADVDVSDFNPEAAAASKWTEDELDDASREFLEGLEPTAELDGAQLFHGSPRDPVWDYVLTELIALESLSLTSAPLVLVGHTHAATALVLTADRLEGGLAAEGARVGPRPGALAPEPRLGRPASRRQPRRLVPRARPGREVGPFSPGRLPCGANAGGDPGKGVAGCAGGAPRSRRLAWPRSPPAAAAATTPSRSRRPRSSARPGRRSRRAVADRLAARSDRIAVRLDAGDGCGAAAEAMRLRDDLTAAINNQAIPAAYLEDLSGAVNELQAQIPQVRAAAAPRRRDDHGRKKHKGKDRKGEDD